MKQITCDFPFVNTTKAVDDVKSSDKNDQSLQNCSVPEVVGGKVHVLLGIQYMNVYPEVIRQLDCGLTIFKSKLVSHDKRFNSIIGGPHSSFEFLANKIGNPAALLTHFVEGLSSLRQLGPPRIPINPQLDDEFKFSQLNSLVEERSLYDAEFSVDGKSCVKCLYQQLDDEPESLKDIKNLRLEQECGVEINYRCPRCPECSSCKDSDKAEAISLREEAEMELIDASVKLDLENKKISCTLPLKGDERQFLTTNYSQALKILEQQLKQYSSHANV